MFLPFIYLLLNDMLCTEMSKYIMIQIISFRFGKGHNYLFLPRLTFFSSYYFLNILFLKALGQHTFDIFTEVLSAVVLLNNIHVL